MKNDLSVFTRVEAGQLQFFAQQPGFLHKKEGEADFSAAPGGAFLIIRSVR